MTPKVTFAGVRIPAQRIPWMFTPGLAPFSTKFKVTRQKAKALVDAAAAKGNVADLVVASSFSLGGESTAIDVTIKGCVLVISEGDTSPWDAEIAISDKRWWLQGELVTASYNIPRVCNEAGAVGVELLGPASAKPVSAGGTLQLSRTGGSVGATPAGLGEASDLGGAAKPIAAGHDRDLLYPVERYLPWSLADGKEPATAKFIAEDLLKQVELKNPGTWRAAVAREVREALEPLTDNGYWEDNVKPRRVDAVATIQEHLDKAELGVAVGKDGKVYAWNVRGETVGLGDDAKHDVDNLLEVIKPLYAPVEAGGFFDVRRNVLRRPAFVSTETPAEWELRVECQDVWDVAWEGTLQPYAQNVLQLPQDTMIGGRLVRKGTWVLVDDALAAWSTELPLAGNPWSRVPLTRARVRELWFPQGKLAMAYTLELGEGGGYVSSSIWQPRINALLACFRQVWRINPGLADYLLSFQPRRSRIVDPRSRTYARAFVAMDHCVVPNVTLPEFTRRRGRAGTNVACWADDASDTAMSAGAHLELRVVDANAYVVQIAPDATKLVQGERVGNVIPSQVENLPVLAGAALMSNEIWSNARLAEAFKATFIGTVTWAMHPDKLTSSRKLARGALADHEGLVHRTTVAAPPGEANKLLSVSFADERVVARLRKDGGATVAANADTLRSLADARAEGFYATLRDKIVGRYEMPGWSDAYRLFGTVAALGLQLDEQGRIHTIWDLSTPPRTRDEILRMPAALRAQLATRLGDAGPHGAAVR